MPKFTIPAVVLTLAVVGCAVEGPTALAPGGPALARGGASAAAPTLRPISGRCELTFTPPPVPPPPVVRQVDVGSCQISHLGRTAFSSVQDINFAAGTQSGQPTFTAANGDVLRALSSGTSGPVGPGLIGFSATLTFIGGTGRFANASGQAVARGVANLVTRTTVTSFEGVIAYDASDRSGQ